MAVIKAIVAGERDPKNLAKLRNTGCKQPQAQFARALEGTWQAEHIFALKQSLAMYEFYQQQIAECDRFIEEYLKTLARPQKPRELPPRAKPRQSKKKNDL